MVTMNRADHRQYSDSLAPIYFPNHRRFIDTVVRYPDNHPGRTAKFDAVLDREGC